MPLLGSVAMLKRMDAVVDFGRGEIVMPKGHRDDRFETKGCNERTSDAESSR